MTNVTIKKEKANVSATNPSLQKKKPHGMKKRGRNNIGGNGQDKKDSTNAMEECSRHVKQKTVKQERQSQRIHGSLVLESLSDYEMIKSKDCSKEKRVAILESLYAKYTGKYFECATKHDASRIIQCMIKYGSPAQRTECITELIPRIVELTKTTFGHFLAMKCIKYGSVSDREMLMKAFEGHMVKLATNASGAAVIELMTEKFKPVWMANLMVEFYGKEFVYFKLQSMKNLKDVLKQQKGDTKKEEQILNNVLNILNRMVDKQLLSFAFVQKLFWEYVSNTSTKNIIDHIIPNIRDVSITMLSTVAGAEVVCKCAAYGNAKDRKRIIRSLKGKVFDACNHPSGYLVLLTLMNVVDDTVMVQKMILNELIPNLHEIALHPKGSKVLLRLLNPESKSFLTEQEMMLLKPPMIPSSDPNSTELVLNYKKSPEVRCSELLKGLREPIEKMVIENIVELISSNIGSKILMECVRLWSNKDVTDAIIARLVNSSDSELYLKDNVRVVLQKLIQMDPNDFSVMFYKEVLQNSSKTVVSLAKDESKGFLILSLLKCKSTLELIKSALKSSLSELELIPKTQKSTRLILEQL